MEIKTDLLRKLADHLMTGELGHERFDLTTINGDGAGCCGTAGCAIGELPILFPDDWQFGDYILEIHLRHDSDGSEWRDVEQYFGITDEMSTHLFSPYGKKTYQKPDLYGGVMLERDTTKEIVASNIIKFCELAESGKFN